MGPDKKEAILKAASKLFLEKGYCGASTNDIASEAGVNKSALHYYFTSKENIFFLLHKENIDELLTPFLEKVLSISDPVERLGVMIKEYTKMVCLHPELRVLIHGTLIGSEKFDDIREEWKNHYLLMRKTIVELQSMGRFRKDLNPSWTALLLIGMMTWITFWFDFERKEQIDEIADCALKIVMSLIEG